MPTWAPSAGELGDDVAHVVDPLRREGPVVGAARPGRAVADAALVDADHAVARARPSCRAHSTQRRPGPMWCSAATLTSTTHGTGPASLRAARSAGSSTTPTMPSGPEPGDPLAHRRGAVGAGADQHGVLGVRRLDRHGGLVVDAGGQPGHDLAQGVLRDDAELGRYVEQLALAGGRAGLEPAPARGGPRSRAAPAGRPGSAAAPGRRAAGRPGACRGRGRAAPWRSPRRTGSPGCAAARRRAPRGVLAEAVERLALAEEGAAGQARVPADQRGERRRRPAAACAAARVAPSRMPTAATVGAPRSRRYWRAASMLASQAGTRSGSSCSPAESPVPS